MTLLILGDDAGAAGAGILMFTLGVAPMPPPPLLLLPLPPDPPLSLLSGPNRFCGGGAPGCMGYGGIVIGMFGGGAAGGWN